MDVIHSIFKYAGDGAKGLWPYLMQMPVSLAVTLGFSALVLMAATLVLAKIKKAMVSGSVYGLVAAAIVVAWLFAWFASHGWGGLSDVCAAVARVASLVGVFWIAFAFVQALFYPQRPRRSGN